VGGSGAVTGQSQSESFPACKAEEALPQSQLAAGPCDPNARRILAGKPPLSDNPSIKTQRLQTFEKKLKGFETDRKLASLDAMIPNSSQMAAFFRSMGTVRHGMF